MFGNYIIMSLMKVGNLKEYSRSVDVVVKVVSKGEVDEIYRESNSMTHKVAGILVADDTGSIVLTLWDDKIDMIEVGDILRIPNGYVSVHEGSLRLNIGRYGSFERVDKAPFDEVNLGNNLSV